MARQKLTRLCAGRQGIQQCLRVSMLRMRQHFNGIAHFNDAAAAHDGHTMGQGCNRRQIMANPDESRAELCNEFLHLRKDFGLHGHIERRRRLVADDQFGAMQKSDGDGDTLAHATGKLVGIVVDLLLGIGNAHLRQRIDGAPARLLGAHLLMRFDRQTDLGADRQHRVQRHHRILKDHGDDLAADRSQFMGRQAHQFPPLQPDRASNDTTWFIDKPDDRKPGNRFARSGLSDKAEDLALVQRKRDPVHGLQLATRCRKPGPEIGHVKKRNGHRRSLGLS